MTCAPLDAAAVNDFNALWTPLFLLASATATSPSPAGDHPPSHLLDRYLSEQQGGPAGERSDVTRLAQEPRRPRVIVYWWNRYASVISSAPPVPPRPCRGGLLADEMVRCFLAIPIYNPYSLLYFSRFCCYVRVVGHG